MSFATARAAGISAEERTRVASSDWWASRKVVSVTATAVWLRSACAKRSGPSSSSSCFDPDGGGVCSSCLVSAGSLSRAIRVVRHSPFGLLTATPARYLSSLVPRSAGIRWVSSCGRSSMNDVVARPARKSGSEMTASRKPMLVEMPRIRISFYAR